MEKAMLITGNPVDGFTYIGPFQTHEEAVEYADTHNDEFDGDWWVATLNAPTEDDVAVNAANTLDRQGLIDAANEAKRLNDNLEDIFPTEG